MNLSHVCLPAALDILGLQLVAHVGELDHDDTVTGDGRCPPFGRPSISTSLAVRLSFTRVLTISARSDRPTRIDD